MQLRKAWTLDSVFEANAVDHTYSLPWKFRLDLLERVAKILSDMHRKNRAYGFGALKTTNIIVASVEKLGLRAIENYPRLDELSPLELLNSSELPAGTNLGQRDMLCFGVLMLEILSEKPLQEKDLPLLFQYLKMHNISPETTQEKNDALKTISNLQFSGKKDPSKPSSVKKGFRAMSKLLRMGSNRSKVPAALLPSPKASEVSSNQFTMDPVVKTEVETYIRAYVTTGALEKPTWLLSLEELATGMLTTVEDARPSAAACRDWLLEVLSSFSKSVENHKRLKALLKKKSADEIVFNETIKRGFSLKDNQFTNYEDYLHMYDLFYSDKVSHNLMNVLLHVKRFENDVALYHSKDFEGDIPDDVSLDSYMPPVDVEKAIDDWDFDTDTKKGSLTANSLEEVFDPNTARDTVTYELKHGMGFLKNKPPPLQNKILGKKANHILEKMQDSRNMIGDVLTTKQALKKLDLQEKLPHENVVNLLKKAREIFKAEDNIIVLDAPVIVVGDVHGQYFDLRQVMKFCGKPKKKQPKASGLTRKRQKNILMQLSRESKRSLNRLRKHPSSNMSENPPPVPVHSQRNPQPSRKPQKNLSKQQLLARTVRISKLRLDYETKGILQELYEEENAQKEQKEKIEEDKGKTFLFLGDYVDRGNWSCETLFYLLSMKVEYPESVILLRGNHECAKMTENYGFREECEHKYGREIYHRCLHVFNALPIGCIINLPDNRRFFACHGGISDKVDSLEQIGKLNRFREPGIEGTLCDLLWSDPVPNDILETHNNLVKELEKGSNKVLFEDIMFMDNEVRMCAKRFGYKAIEDFLKRNKLNGLIRAHEAKEEGFQFHFENAGTKDHVCVTVFSAPNYTQNHGNKGAIMIVHPTVQARLDHQMQRLDYKFTQEDILKTHDAKKDACIDLLEPICYHETTQPEVLYHENETWNLITSIEETCPYMPTNIEEFYNGALDVLEKHGTAQQQLMNLQKMEELKDKMAAEDLVQIELLRHQKSKTREEHFSQNTLEGFKSLRKNNYTSSTRDGLLLKRESAHQKKFQKTLKRVHESHPDKFSEKFRVASSKLEKMMLKSERDLSQVRPNSRPRSNLSSAAPSSPKTLKMQQFKTLPSTSNFLEGTDMTNFFSAVQGRSFMWREKFEIEGKDSWLEMLADWFSNVAGSSIGPERDEFCAALENCVILCKVASKVLNKPNIKYTKPSSSDGQGLLQMKLNAFEIRQNLLVFQDMCKELGIRYMFFASDILNKDINFILPVLIELAKAAKSNNTLETSLSALVSQEMWTKPLSSELPETDEELRTHDIEIGNVSFNSQERLMLQLLFLTIDREDTGALTASGIELWATEENKFIQRAHAEQVVSAIDYDNDQVIGIKDFFQFASRLKEDYEEDSESLDGYDTPSEFFEERDEFMQPSIFADDVIKTIDLNEVNFDDSGSEDSGFHNAKEV